MSYTWGSDATHKLIELNGVMTPIRDNLWSFLNKRRLQQEYGPLWADAICINQANISELNHQVQMMHQIYESAQSVSVWLGDADNDSDIAIQRVKSPTVPKNWCEGAWTKSEGLAILALCERNYWRRMWIIQELLLAKSAVIHCGLLDLNWSILVRFLGELQEFKKQGRDIYTPLAHSILATPAMAMVKTKTEWGATPQPLRVLVESYRHHQSTDIRDKVYALLGIAEGTSDVTIDYHKSAKTILLDVYCNEARRSDGDLDPPNRTIGQLLRFRNSLQGTLDVTVTEAEVYTHAGCPEHWIHTNSRPCPFEFLNCSFKTYQQYEWTKHSLSHFQSVEPPRSAYCLGCDMAPKRFRTGGMPGSTNLSTCQIAYMLHERKSRVLIAISFSISGNAA